MRRIVAVLTTAAVLGTACGDEEVAVGRAGSAPRSTTTTASAPPPTTSVSPTSTLVTTTSTVVAVTTNETPVEQRLRGQREAAAAEIANGTWGPELDELPAERFIAVDLAERIGAVSIDGEPLGWVNGEFEAVREVNVPVPASSLDPDVDVSVALGVECTFVGRDGSDDLYLCSHPEIEDAWASQIVRRVAPDVFGTVAGPAWGPWELADGQVITGHWRWIDAFGDMVLGQWSGECEVPTAHLVAGDIWSVVLADDGVALVTKAEAELDDVIVPASYALGWTSSGEALIHIVSTPCSHAAPGGIYVVDPAAGSVELLLQTERPTVLVRG